MNLCFKKILAGVLATISIVTSSSIGSLPTAFADLLPSGFCGNEDEGKNIKWTFDESTGVLEFTGNGAMDQWNYYVYYAWSYSKYADKVKEVVFNEGITEIGSCAFANLESNVNLYPNLEIVKLPSTLKKIGNCAFKDTNIGEILFPISLTQIGERAFMSTKLRSISLHDGMSIGGLAFANIDSISNIFVNKNITYGFSNFGSQGMGRPPATFSNCTGLEKVTIEDGSKITDTWQNVKSINGLGEYLFSGCTSLKTVIIGGNVDYIPARTFGGCPSLSDMYFYTPDLSTIGKKGDNNGYDESIDSDSNPTYYVIKGSKTETTLRNADYLTDDNVVYIAGEDDINELKEAIEKSETFDTNKCTEDYTKKLTDAVSSGKEIIDKYDNDKFSGITLDEVEKVLNVLDNPEYKPADYTSVDEALAKADKLDLSKYTDESANALKDAIKAVVRDLDITKQSDVDAFAKAINDAIDALKEKPVQSSSQTTTTTTAPGSKPSSTSKTTTATTRSPSQVAKDKKNAENKVKQAKITHLKAKSKSKKKITVSWKKVKKAVGYQVQVSKKKNFKKNLFDKFTTKKKITFKKKLKSGKTYYVRVRAYTTYKDAYGRPQKVYSKWIKKVRKVNVK